jgi:alkylated DNA repair dioxygenase AlkB
MYEGLVDEPRLTAEVPVLSQAPIQALRDIGAALSAQYGVTFDGLWLNLYRDHRDSTSWHADSHARKRPECVVPVLSLGATRRFLVRPREGGRSISFTVAGGDLIAMGGRCQRDWLHCVPKETQRAGTRISVNFKSSGPTEPGGR